MEEAGAASVEEAGAELFEAAGAVVEDPLAPELILDVDELEAGTVSGTVALATFAVVVSLATVELAGVVF